MRGAGPKRLLVTSATFTVACIAAAAVLWILAVVASWDAECPPGPRTVEGRVAQPVGLDKGIYAWPPAAQCFTEDGVSPHEAMPWASWAILGLAGGGGAILLLGLIVAMRDLGFRSRAEVP